MKKLAVLAVLAVSPISGYEGIAFSQSLDAHLVMGYYERGSKAWDEKNQDWLDSDEDTPYPDDLKQVDGDAYIEGQDAALNADKIELVEE